MLMILWETVGFRLNTNVELCKSLKELLDNPEIVAQLDPDTRSVSYDWVDCHFLLKNKTKKPFYLVIIVTCCDVSFPPQTCSGVVHV